MLYENCYIKYGFRSNILRTQCDSFENAERLHASGDLLFRQKNLKFLLHFRDANNQLGYQSSIAYGITL